MMITDITSTFGRSFSWIPIVVAALFVAWFLYWFVNYVWENHFDPRIKFG